MQPLDQDLFHQFPAAILFTNARGRVVFANRNYLRMTKEPASKVVAGERLEAFLPVDAQSSDRVLHVIGESGHMDGMAISISTTTGSMIPTICSGAAAHDEKGVFIGADIVLSPHNMAAPQAPGLLAPKHTDILRAYVGEVFEDAGRTHSNTFIQAYVIAQLDMLQVLLARMGGPEMRKTFERILNETAVKNNIPAWMQSGYLEFTLKPMHFGVYRTLLRAAMGYTIDAIGQRIVKREMQAVDRYVDPGLLELVTQMDLRTTFADD